ncbi:membrane protein [Staphylococcus phage CF5]|uniref:Membrane protein n=1 Tax=Staphylococcus phage CF5 TaxID=3113739 RepID=A0AAX4J753_9CAUD|nr:membrane protein [Staphylococcus phage CF5]
MELILDLLVNVIFIIAGSLLFFIYVTSSRDKFGLDLLSLTGLALLIPVMSFYYHVSLSITNFIFILVIMITIGSRLVFKLNK